MSYLDDEELKSDILDEEEPEELEDAIGFLDEPLEDDLLADNDEDDDLVGLNGDEL